MKKKNTKDQALCHSCVFAFRNCKAECVGCPQKLPKKSGHCKCLKIKLGEECPYYRMDRRAKNGGK